MIALIAILLLLIVPAIMLVLHLTRLTSKFLWLVAMLGAFSAWVLVYLARFNMPYVIAPQTWQPTDLFPLSPTMKVDNFSWIFSMALVTLLLAVVLTSVTRLGRQGFSQQVPSLAMENIENQTDNTTSTAQSVHWKTWAAYLALTSLGLVAVLAGNMLTLLLGWAALDIVEVVILLGQGTTREERDQVMRSLSARLGGVVVLIMAGVLAWGQGEGFDFNPSSGIVSLFLLSAAGLRLGILPIFVPTMRELPVRIGLGTILHLVSVASSLMLLVRSASSGVRGTAGLVLLGFTTLAGLVGGIGWLRVRDYQIGRPYWILATSSLVMAAAILGQPEASLAWSLVVILSGSLLFLSTLKQRFMLIIWSFGAMSITGIPFTPAWIGSKIFEMHYSGNGVAVQFAVGLMGILFFIVHVTLLIGYIRFILRSISNLVTESQSKVERWVWLLYILGLISLPGVHITLSLMIPSETAQISRVMWVEGVSASVLAFAIWVYSSRTVRLTRIFQADRQWFSSEQIYLPLTRFFAWSSKLLSQIIRVISIILEGEAGILWAFVLLVLGLAFLQRY